MYKTITTLLLAVFPLNLSAAPISLDLTGTVTGATGSRAAAGDLGTSLSESRATCTGAMLLGLGM